MGAGAQLAGNKPAAGIRDLGRCHALMARAAVLLAKREYVVAAEAAMEAAKLAEGTTEPELPAALSIAAAAFKAAGRPNASAEATARARAVLAGSSPAIPGGRARRFTRVGSGHDTEVDAIDLLSRRERQILELVGEGARNAEIADQLVLSKKTVENHLSRVFAKLGVSSRTAAARMLAEHTEHDAPPA